MPLNPGAYDRRVIVQKPTESVDTRGGITRSWSQHKVLWMAMEGESGGESFTADQDRATETVQFRTHYTPGLSPKMRLLVPGHTTTLATGIQDAASAVKVASADGFPLEGTYRVRIGSELMEVTDGQGTTTWTADRGVDGTTAASATQGAAVSHMQVYNIRSVAGDRGRRVEAVITAEGRETLG